MNWCYRRVFVTGATGFLGSRLQYKLTELGANVVGLMRDTPLICRVGDLVDRLGSIAWAQGDVRDQPLLERVLGEYEVETVFHLAAQTQVSVANANPVSTFETNVQGTVALLEACRRSPKVRQIVVASSDKAYGEGLNKEEDYAAMNPVHPYDVSKACADRIAQTYARMWGLPVAITRCANLFGGGDFNWSRLVPGTIRSVLRGERPVLRGTGEEVRDWLHVSDAVAGYIQLAEWIGGSNTDERNCYLEDGGAFNFSLGIQETSLEVVRLITQLCGEDVAPIVQGTATGEISKQGLCCDKARRLLGWKPKVGLGEGLKEAVEWYKRYT